MLPSGFFQWDSILVLPAGVEAAIDFPSDWDTIQEEATPADLEASTMDVDHDEVEEVDIDVHKT